MKCENCGFTIEDFSKMYCPNCFIIIGTDKFFCYRCSNESCYNIFEEEQTEMIAGNRYCKKCKIKMCEEVKRRQDVMRKTGYFGHFERWKDG